MHLYNDTEPFVCSWLEQLTKHNHLPHGTIDQRPIQQLTAADLAPYTQCHFFAGIGGWPLALRLAGWPDDLPVWTGSCPCQPFSCAGQGRGTDDERHLWPEFKRLIDECKPPVVFGEQVASKAGRLWLDGVRADLEKLGYVVGAADLCAAGVGAPHIRQRLFWVAYSGGARTGRDTRATLSAQESLRGKRDSNGLHESDSLVFGGAVGGVAYTASSRLDGAKQGSEGEARNEARLRVPREDCGPSRLEQAEGDGREQRGTEPSGRGAAGGRESCGVANVQQPGLEGHAGNGDDGDQSRRNHADPAGSVAEGGGFSFWTNAEWLPCLDGKARRIEPGTFPLAHGVPGRVGLLRGYGNAIVPELAAEFIQAAIEAIQLATT